VHHPRPALRNPRIATTLRSRAQRTDEVAERGLRVLGRAQRPRRCGLRPHRRRANAW
jgi:hypothetical protein